VQNDSSAYLPNAARVLSFKGLMNPDRRSDGAIRF
jgi:hypothetical protein